MRYYLIGYMCSGKSCIGKDLSLKWDIRTYDLDEEIEEYCEMSISEIFNTYGEDKFRKIESFVLKNLTENHDNCIISTGGGTPMNNMEYMKENGIVIYLNTKVNDILKRLTPVEIDKRPRLKNIKNLKKFIIFELKEREKIYNQADLIVNDYEKFINSKWS